MSETKPPIKFGAWEPTEYEFLQEIDEWLQQDMAADYIDEFFNRFNRLPEVDQVQEYYEHKYIDDIIVKKELVRYESSLFHLQKAKEQKGSQI